MEIGTRNLGPSSPKLDTLYQFLSRFLSSILLCTETLNATSQEKFINFKKVFCVLHMPAAFILFIYNDKLKIRHNEIIIEFHMTIKRTSQVSGV